MALTFDALRAGVDRLAPELLAATDTPGCLVTIGLNGRPPLTLPYGLADVTTGAPMTSQHTMRVGSLGKLLVATAVTDLAHDGVLDLDEPIDDYLPFTVTNPQGGTITLAKALGMLTGATTDGYHWVETPEPAAKYVARELERGVTHEYGLGAPRFADSADAGQWRPSSFMYELAAVAAETVTGVPLGQHVGTAILDPLGLCDTAWWDSTHWDEVRSRCTAGHLLLGGHALPLPWHECGAYHSVGAVMSPADYTRLMLALVNREGVFRDEVVRTLLQPRTAARGNLNIGFGLQTTGHPDEEDFCIQVVGHYAFGWWAAALAYPNAVQPCCVTVCTNLSDQSTGVFNPPEQYAFGILAQEITGWLRQDRVDVRDLGSREARDSYVRGLITADRFAGLMGAELSRETITRMATCARPVGSAPATEVDEELFTAGYLDMQAAIRDCRIDEFLSHGCPVGGPFRKLVRKGWGAKDFADPIPVEFFFPR